MTPPGGADDDKTQLIARDTLTDHDKTIIPGKLGQGLTMPQGGAPGGKLIGSDNIQAQVRVAGQPRPAGAPPPDAPAPQGGGETVFFVGQAGQDANAPPFNPVVGWLAVVNGPGRGEFKPVFYGQNTIGRGPDQKIRLDFGDQRISRSTHAFIIYDERTRRFFLRDAGQSNLVRHKDNLVLTPTEIKDRDEITLGDTTLLFVALCNADFDWLAGNEPKA